MLIKKMKNNKGESVILFKEENKTDHLINNALCLLEDCSSYKPTKNLKKGGKNYEQDTISIKIR